MKTQTRRVISIASDAEEIWWQDGQPGFPKQAPTGRVLQGYTGWTYRLASPVCLPLKCPYGKVGDRLWVRETFHCEEEPRESSDDPQYFTIVYRADDRTRMVDALGNELESERDVCCNSEELKFKPSIFMPRSASRITLEVTRIRVERVNQITHEDAVAEGIQSWIDGFKKGPHYHQNGQLDAYPVTAFARLWDEINAGRGYSWKSNPWVWVIDFKRVLDVRTDVMHRPILMSAPMVLATLDQEVAHV